MANQDEVDRLLEQARQRQAAQEEAQANRAAEDAQRQAREAAAQFAQMVREGRKQPQPR